LTSLNPFEVIADISFIVDVTFLVNQDDPPTFCDNNCSGSKMAWCWSASNTKLNASIKII